jgi:hypothetical protein
MGRKRLAQLAERQRSGRRLGFGARTGEPDAGTTAPAAATGPGSGAATAAGGAER